MDAKAEHSRRLIMKIDNERIHFNPELSIGIHNSNIPSDFLSFRSHVELYWVVEMLGYDEVNKSLRVSVVDYDAKEISAFANQTPKKLVCEVLFNKFDWPQLEPLLSSYKKIRLVEILDNIEANPFQFSRPIHENEKIPTDQLPATRNFLIDNLDNGKRQHVETFSILFTNCTFHLGFVSFTKKLSFQSDPFPFQISNDNILPEFDAIKPWFAKRLGTKKFNVIAEISFDPNGKMSIRATSPEIAQIDQSLIDGVKYQRALSISSPPNVFVPDKSLFSSEDVFSCFDEDPQGNVFAQSENEIFNILVENAEIRNKSQLVYLSGKKQSTTHKLRFTLNPDFGFLFFVEGNECNHFVWELLNSNATYIWSIEREFGDIDLQYARVERAINAIRNHGRQMYKSAYRSNNQDADLVFNVIQHKHIGSNFIDSFPRWKSKLNELLV